MGFWDFFRRGREAADTRADRADARAAESDGRAVYAIKRLALSKRALSSLGANALLYGRNDAGRVVFIMSAGPLDGLEVEEGDIVGADVEQVLTNWGVPDIYPFYMRGLAGERVSIVWQPGNGWPDFLVNITPNWDGTATSAWIGLPAAELPREGPNDK